MNEKKLEDSVCKTETKSGLIHGSYHGKIVRVVLSVLGLVPMRDGQDVLTLLPPDFIVDDICPENYPERQFEPKPALPSVSDGLFFLRKEKNRFFIPKKIGKADTRAKGNCCR